MPVTIYPAPHGANAFSFPTGSNHFATSARGFLEQLSKKEDRKAKSLCATSFNNIGPDSNILPTKNGFIDAAFRAYNQHHHLEIRPDDIWITILTQLNVYINAHAEELRDMFVEHQGQKKLTIQVQKGGVSDSLWGIYWGQLSYQMTQKIADNVKDPSLRDWILPDFSTTTKDDLVVASIIMMATMQKYFSYEAYCLCGLPSVTLLGQKEDWEKLAVKAERLASFGKEPEIFCSLLKPILARFVRSFDEPDSTEIKDFWQKIVQPDSGGSGPPTLDGWITAFCVWGNEAKFLYDNPAPEGYIFGWERALKLDGISYHSIEIKDVSLAWTSGPLRLDDNGAITETTLVAGLVGMKVSSSGKELHEKTETGLDTLSVASGWWMYEKLSDEEMKAARVVRHADFKANHPFGIDKPEWLSDEE
ncbi:hypothetical protein ACEPPN_010870 [Leptodophora sp. 'Broadleaf-Isolate-01']